MHDKTELAILDDGYIAIDRLRRRWLVSQTIKCYTLGTGAFERKFIAGTPYRYEWETALQELNIARQLPAGQKRKALRFFNERTVKGMLSHYLSKIGLSADIDGICTGISSSCSFIKKFLKTTELSDGIPKSEIWVDTFRGVGAYYTMSELIKYHGYHIIWQDKTLGLYDSLRTLEKITDACVGDYNRLYEIMADFLRYNGISAETIEETTR